MASALQQALQRGAFSERLKREESGMVTTLETLKEVGTHLGMYLGLIIYTVVGAKVRDHFAMPWPTNYKLETIHAAPASILTIIKE